MRFSDERSDDLFYAKIADLFDIAEKKHTPRFTHFLDEAQVFLAERYLAEKHLDNWLLWGGHDTAKRKILGAFPDYMEPSGEEFPLSAFTFTYRKEDTLSHRDFLGSLMSLQIKREAVGDILVSEGSCVLFTTDKVSPLILSEVKKIGRIGVKIQPGILVPLMQEERFQELGGTVASLRLDSIVSLLTGKSRERSAEFIKNGLVMVNYKPAEKSSLLLKPADILSVRGFGKAKVSDDIRETKKGRYFVNLLKYV